MSDSNAGRYCECCDDGDGGGVDGNDGGDYSHVVCENCDDCGVYQGIACPTVEPVLLLNKRRLKLIKLFKLRRLSCFARDN